MNDRKKQLIKALILAHVSSALPVGSQILLEKSELELSSATVRNELTELEKAGYVQHLHISSGRIPTEKAYMFFVKKCMQRKELTKDEKKRIDAAVVNKSGRERVKALAKAIAESSHNAVFIGFTRDDIYYTGLAHLFSKPEFTEQGYVFAMSCVWDHMDDVIHEKFDEFTDELQILIGSQNPFSRDCSAFVSTFGKKEKGVFGILSIMRTDYEMNATLLDYGRRLVEN